MPLRLQRLFHALGLALVAQAASAVPAGTSRLQPSDCRPRDADSTCATAVAGATAPQPPMNDPDTTLYDGPLAGVPASGYAYWGYDFVADQTGLPSPVRPDLFINRSTVPVTIRLSFDIPADRACNKACLPGVQFQVDGGWFKLDPPFQIAGTTASASETFAPGRGYGWVIGLWRGSNARLRVSIPQGRVATLAEVGQAAQPGVVNEIAAVTGLCDCPDGFPATCSDGSRFSNGLLGPWSQGYSTYVRAGAFNNCTPQR